MDSRWRYYHEFSGLGVDNPIRGFESDCSYSHSRVNKEGLTCFPEPSQTFCYQETLVMEAMPVHRRATSAFWKLDGDTTDSIVRIAAVFENIAAQRAKLNNFRRLLFVRFHWNGTPGWHFDVSRFLSSISDLFSLVIFFPYCCCLLFTPQFAVVVGRSGYARSLGHEHPSYSPCPVNHSTSLLLHSSASQNAFLSLFPLPPFFFWSLQHC